MNRIRALSPGDLPALAALWLRTSRRRGSESAVARYFGDVFFASPPGLEGEPIASLVREDDTGAISGFIGALPRRMLFRGRPISAIVATQLMVEPGPGLAVTAFELLHALFAGPQHLTLSDGANDLAANLWQRSGGVVMRSYCLDWRRVLRPVSFARARAASRYPAIAMSAVSRAIGLAVDAALDRLRAPRATLVEERLTEEAMLSLLGRARYELRPAYDATFLEWVFREASATRGHGTLRRRLCKDGRGNPVGFYVYYAKPRAVGRVLQLFGAPRQVESVLESLFADALREGCVAVSGQIEPRYLRELTVSHASFSCPSLNVLAHSRNEAILSSIHRGDAHLTRLDGEWWLRFR